MARIASTLAEFSGRGHSPLHAVASLYRSFVKAMSIQAEMQSRMDRIARLNAMSDGELNELGVKRDQIVHHVFRDIYYL